MLSDVAARYRLVPCTQRTMVVGLSFVCAALVVTAYVLLTRVEGQLPISTLDLVSRWRAEGDGRDAFGANEAVLVNGVSFQRGRVGQAFSFDGVDDYVVGAPEKARSEEFAVLCGETAVAMRKVR